MPGELRRVASEHSESAALRCIEAVHVGCGLASRPRWVRTEKMAGATDDGSNIICCHLTCCLAHAMCFAS